MIEDWDLGLGIRIGDWGFELGIWIGDWNWDWGLGFEGCSEFFCLAGLGWVALHRITIIISLHFLC